MKTYNTGDKVRVEIKRRKTSKDIGRGKPENKFTVTIDGESGTFVHGEIMQVSENTSKKVLNRSAGDMPLVNSDIVNGLFSIYFSLVERKKKSKKKSVTNNEDTESTNTKIKE